MRATIAATARRTRPREWIALAMALAIFGYLGWDGPLWDARLQLVLHLVAAGAIAALAVHAWRGGEIPRTGIDAPVLGLVAAFALATLFAINLGMSLRALASIIATALMLPIALLLLRHRPSAVALVACVPTLVLAASTLGAMVGRRVAWVLAGAPGLPPIRLPAELTPFGSVAVAPMILLATWALAGVIEAPAARRSVRLSIVVIGLPLLVLSGSRSALLAVAVAAAIIGWPMLGRALATMRRPGLDRSATAWRAAGVVLASGALIYLLPRLGAMSSLLYRADLWRDTLAAWARSPITGVGPGIMPYARQAAAVDGSFPVAQPHSHNLPLGVLGDAGVIGLIAAAVAAIVLLRIAGPWRSRTRIGRDAAAVLVGIGIAGLFEDLTFLPNFNLLVVLLLAVALADAGVVRWQSVRPRGARLAASALIGITLAAAMAVSDAGGIAYRAGSDAAERGDWRGAMAAYDLAARIDRWHPAGPDALGIAASRTGDLEAARSALARATGLAPGNGRAWANLAIVCGELDDPTCTGEAAGRAVATARLGDPTLLNAALVLDRIGDHEAADVAYRRALLTGVYVPFTVDWPRQISVGEGLVDATPGVATELTLLLARVETGEPAVPEDYATAAVRALALAIDGREGEARAWLDRATVESPQIAITWQVEMVLRHAWGESTQRDAAILGVLSGRPVSATPPARSSPPPGLIYDIATFRSYPRGGLVDGAIAFRVDPPFPWVLGSLLGDP